MFCEPSIIIHICVYPSMHVCFARVVLLIGALIATQGIIVYAFVCTRMCESTGVAAQRTVAVLLPTLLDKGIVSNVPEVRTLR